MEKHERSAGATPYKPPCGGQALIEGILMQGPEKRAVVVRKPSGELDITTSKNKARGAWARLPLVRGVFVFGSAMVHGVKALMYSAEVSEEGLESQETQEPSRLETWLESHFPQEKASSIFVTLAAVLGMAFSVALFILLPTAIPGLIRLVWPQMPLWVQAVLEGVLKVAIFMCYLWLCSRTKEMRRVFSYHGAEHKAIFCYENGLELTVENVKKQPRHHPRCGTSFLFVVIVVSIFLSIVIFTPLEITNTLLRMALHLVLLHIIVGVTYEFNRYVGGHDNALCRALRAPGMWMQNFTTFEPDESMIEVAITALNLVLPENKGADAW